VITMNQAVLPTNAPESAAPNAERRGDAAPIRLVIHNSEQARHAAKLLLRAGFAVADTPAGDRASGNETSGGPMTEAADVRSDATIQDLVAQMDLAVRVTRAAECLDDPTTALMANLDTIHSDLADGAFRAADLAEAVGDCMAAVKQLQEGLQRLKAVAAPPVLPQSGSADLAAILEDAIARHRGRSVVDVTGAGLQGLRVRGDQALLAQALADTFEVLAECRRPANGAGIRVTLSRAGEGVRIYVSDAGARLDASAALVLAGGMRPSSPEGFALLAASALVRGVGGRIRIMDLPRRACLEVQLPQVY
jgi:hypothetical protein